MIQRRPQWLEENCFAGMVLVKKYTLIKEIGFGANAVVYLATVQQDSKSPDETQQVAVKVIQKGLLTGKHLELLANEISVMKQLDSPFIVKFIEEISIDPQFSWIVMEYCNQGTLAQWTNQYSSQITDRHKKSIFIQILFAFKELHSQNIMHRDIKLDNILIHNGTLKLSDFGFSKQLSSSGITSTHLGTDATMAPEVRLSEYSISAEVYSLGVIFYQISKQQYPYFAKNMFELNRLIKEGKPDYSGLSDNLIDLLQQMLRYNPEERITFRDILVHQFFSNNGEENFVNSAFGQEEFELQKQEFASFYEKLQEVVKAKQMDAITEHSEVSWSSAINIRHDPDNQYDNESYNIVSQNPNNNQPPQQNIKQSQSSPQIINNPVEKSSQSSWMSNSSRQEFSQSKQNLEDLQKIEAKCHALVKEFSDSQQNYMYIIMAANKMILLNMFCEENRQKFSVYIFSALLILKEKVTQMRQALWDELQGNKYVFLKSNSPKDFYKFEKQLRDDINQIVIFDGICKNQIQNQSYKCYYKEFQGVLNDCFIQERKLPVQESQKPQVEMIVIDILLDLTNPEKVGGNRDYKDKTDNSDILKRIQMVQRQACSYLTLACLVEKPNINIAQIEKRLLEGQNYQQELKDQLYQLIQDVPDGNDPDFKDPMKLFLERKHKLLFK